MWFITIGIIALVLGILYWFCPSVIDKLDHIGRLIIINPNKMLEKRKMVSIFYFLAGILLVSITIIK